MVDKKASRSNKTDKKISSPKKTDKKVGSSKKTTIKVSSSKKTDKKVSRSKKTDNRNWLKKTWDFITKYKCPKCKKSGGRKTNREYIKSFDHLETVEMEDRHHDSEGRHIGSTYRDEQVVLQTDIYNIHYCCDYCGHKWCERDEETFQP